MVLGEGRSSENLAHLRRGRHVWVNQTVTGAYSPDAPPASQKAQFPPMGVTIKSSGGGPTGTPPPM